MGLTINTEGMYCCAVCQAPYDSIRGLSTHVLKKHSMDARTYYDTHVKHGTEGTCPVCGKPTKFRSLGEGYKTCCSHECWGKYFSSDKEKVAKRNAKSEATAMSRYGVKNAGGSKEALEKEFGQAWRPVSYAEQGGDREIQGNMPIQVWCNHIRA